MIRQDLWKRLASECNDVSVDTAISSSDQALSAFATHADIATIEKLYRELEHDPDLSSLNKTLQTYSDYCFKKTYFPSNVCTAQFDAWTYGIFRGFHWEGFTVTADNFDDFNAEISFTVWSPYYPVIRQLISYFYDFISARLNIDPDRILTTINSNYLQLFIPGFVRKFSLFIVFRNIMETNVPCQRLMHNNVLYYRQDDVTATRHQSSDAILCYQETPESFYKRTEMPAVTTTLLLKEIYPDLTLVFEIARGDYTNSQVLQSFIKKYQCYLNCTINRTSDITKIWIQGNNKRTRYKFNTITPKRLMSFIYNVAYTQRSLQK
jgi:hypothetical protein